MKENICWTVFRRVCTCVFLAPTPTGQRHRILSIIIVAFACGLAWLGMTAGEPSLQTVARTRNQAKLARIAMTAQQWDVRQAAATKLSDQQLLFQIAMESKERTIRQTAATKLIDQALLAKYFARTEDYWDEREGVRRLTNETQRAQFVLELNEIGAKKWINYNSNKRDLLKDIIARLTNQVLLEKLAVDAQPELGGYAAAAGLTDQKRLARLAFDDKACQIRGVVVRKLNDQVLLAKIAMEVQDTKDDRAVRIGRQAADKLTNEVLLAEMGMWVRPEWTRKVTDQALLARIAMKSAYDEVREVAVEQLATQASLAKLAIEASDDYVRHKAADKLTDQALLAQVAVAATDTEIRNNAVGCLTNLDLLAKIAVSDKREGVRKRAVHSLDYRRTEASNQLARAIEFSIIRSNRPPAYNGPYPDFGTEIGVEER